MVNWQGKTVLFRAIESYVTEASLSRVAVNAEEDAAWGISRFVQGQFPGLEYVRVPSSSKGALASAVLSLDQWEFERPLVIASGDSAIDDGIKEFLEEFQRRGLDAATIGFRSENPRWSFLDVGIDGAVHQVAEKQVIGSIATTGVFYFRSIELFLEAATWCFVNNANVSGNYYVSHTLNYLISSGMTVGYSEVPRSRYWSWSLPVDFTEQSE